MRSRRHGVTWLLRLMMAGSVAANAAVPAQSSGGNYELIQTTTDAGGGSAAGGAFELIATIAQPEADARLSSGGDYALAGGFWANADDLIFANGFEEN